MATCKNGHYYPDDKTECPYCPKTADSAESSRGTSLLRTVIGVPEAFDAPPAQPEWRGTPAAPPQEPSPSALQTQIEGSPHAQPEAGAPEGFRKLMGWLVTFDRTPVGQDFHLWEGRNMIGTAADCDVRITGDANISGRHLTILFRLGEVLFRDELSTNGTFINGNLTNEGRLRDGDVIRVGNTHLLYRSAQTHHTDEIH